MGLCLSLDERNPNVVIDLELEGHHHLCHHVFPHGMPGRLCKNGSTSSASLYTRQGQKCINQDTMLVWERFGSGKDIVFCGVFDGHGTWGHLVARKVSDDLPTLLALSDVSPPNAAAENVTFQNIGIHRDDGAREATKMHFDATGPTDIDFGEVWRDKLLKAFHLMDTKLRVDPDIDCFRSGTTAVAMIVQGKHFIIGNVGDSRAVLGSRSPDGRLVSHQLTTDLKPNLPGESERIKSCNGLVYALRDEPNVMRVWSPLANMPGLAMTRAFGDFCLKEYGVIATPDISYRMLKEEDEFVVLASDGIWEVLSNDDVVRIVASTHEKRDAAKAVVRAATRAWKRQYGFWKADDCTVVCYILKETPTP